MENSSPTAGFGGLFYICSMVKVFSGSLAALLEAAGLLLAASLLPELELLMELEELATGFEEAGRVELLEEVAPPPPLLWLEEDAG